MLTRLALIAVIALQLAILPAKAGDVAKGEMVFQRCISCHAETAGGPNTGPTLKKVFGRSIASVSGYPYSESMKAFASQHQVWDEETLDLFLEAPFEVVKGTKMLTAPVRRDTERTDLIAYLKTF